jgi:hypothetical protein
VKLAALFLALGAAIGCGVEKRTEVLIVADSNLSIPDQIDRIDFEVVPPEGEAQRAGAEIRGAVDLPAVLGLVHRGGSLGPFQVNATASLGGADTVSRTQRFSFVPGETLELRIDLLRRCIGQVCGTGETCGNEGCRPIEVSPDELVAWSGTPSRLDGAIVGDGGGDAGDGGVDGGDGSVDAGCVLDTECDDLVACTSDTCVGGECQHAPDDGACTSGDVCDPVEGCGGRPCDDNADCDDGSFCNGMESCVGMRCATSAAPSCNDGIACTTDRCDDVMGGCVNQPDDSACDDSIGCTNDTCDAVMGCQSTPDDSACDDTFACTTDTCLAGTGCVNTPESSACTPGELCTVAMGCVSAPTFTEVYTDILSVDCTPCHTRMNPAANLSYADQASAYADLVGVSAECGTGNVRVIAGDSMSSLLWRKVAGVDLCGSRMPNGRTPLPDAKIDEIRDWIAAGALNN